MTVLVKRSARSRRPEKFCSILWNSWYRGWVRSDGPCGRTQRDRATGRVREIA